MNFFYLLNTSESLVVYVHTTKLGDLIYAIKLFIKNKKNKHHKKLSLIYSSENNNTINEVFDDVDLYHSTINFESSLLLHNKSKDRIASKTHVKEKFISLYEKISLTANDVNERLIRLNRKPNLNLERATQKCKNELFSMHSDVVAKQNAALDTLIEFIYTNISNSSNFDFKTFFGYYAVPCMSGSWFGDKTLYQTVIYENIYYRNKGFYNADGSFFDINEISQDIEYQNYNKTKLKIDTANAIHVVDPTLFLDYIYDFYNFGEFWDVVQRILTINITGNIKLFGLDKHKVSNIETYFNKCGLEYPPSYTRDFCWKDVEHETNKGSTFFFKKLYFSTIQNTCRGSLNPWITFKMNTYYNPSCASRETFKIYLSRGKEKRGMVNEEHLISRLTQEGFVILDGSETLQKQIFYFTNASLIVGVHSSLMKNIVWCKQNPVFMELIPPSRSHLCFIGNAEQLGFKAIPLLCNANEHEEIVMSDNEILDLVDLIKCLYV